MAKERLDKLVLERGLAETRTRAHAMILAGQILVDEQRVDKPGHLINVEARIRVKGQQLRYVGRGGLKLEAALREFKIDPTGKNCLDVGASTGGFTDCLLQHGAAHVWAIDVGRNQLAWRIRQDPRVVAMEGVNARNLTPDMFPLTFDLATVDVSFISLAKVLPAIKDCLDSKADCIALVKPQFEVGKGEVGRGGIVRDRLKHRRVLVEIVRAAGALKFFPAGLIESPIPGADGNREYLMHLSTTPPPGEIDMDELILQLTTGGGP